MVAKAETNGDVLPLSTLASALTRATLPREELVSAFTRACGCGPDEVNRWPAARKGVATQQVGPPPGPGHDDHARKKSRETRTGVLVLVCLLLAVLTASYPGARSPAGQVSTPCPGVLRPGTVGVCVEEVQSWLVRAGLPMPVDGVYGPYTKMKVVVFQLYAGIPSTGMVDERTLRALRTGHPKIVTWSADRVERRLREVFPEEPDHVVALVRCLSHLDPLWVFGNEDGSRMWGLFQLTDREVVLDHKVSYLTALDPEWNIQTARQIRDRPGGQERWTCTRPG